MKDEQNLWFFLFTLLFVFVFAFLEWVLFSVNGYVPRHISLFGSILIVLASFRLTRLFVYDQIMKFVRDLFWDEKEGQRVSPEKGPKKTLWHLSNCPWCAGLWFSMLVAFFYFLTPLAWFPILVLAIAGLATFFQLLTRLVGRRGER